MDIRKKQALHYFSRAYNLSCAASILTDLQHPDELVRLGIPADKRDARIAMLSVMAQMIEPEIERAVNAGIDHWNGVTG